MPTNQTQTPCNCSPDNSGLQQQIENFYTTLPGIEWAAGLSVGIINGLGGSGNPVITKCHSGYANANSGLPIDQDTIFEIGSTTKPFTATMMAAAVNNGEFNLDAPAQDLYNKYAPGVALPVYTDPITHDEYPMTMLDLADYTSGIPDKSPTNQQGPNEYTFSMMHDYLEGLGSLSVQPGTQSKYVNTNFGIIAELMMAMGNFSTYQDALVQMLNEADLTMENTGVIESNTPSIANLAQGYLYTGDAAPNYALPTWPALQGAGAIYSTLDDMVEWLQFNMGLTNSPYTVLLPMLQKVWFPTASGGNGLGWFISTLAGTTLLLISKNGGTSGFHSWMGFLPDANVGAVLLCNTNLAGRYSGGVSPVDSFGQAILQELV
jgi:D-alanyl-D-alanine-carboxypeptidase/D-alanyl-D-alanine-endopeptidase